MTTAAGDILYGSVRGVMFESYSMGCFIIKFEGMIHKSYSMGCFKTKCEGNNTQKLQNVM